MNYRNPGLYKALVSVFGVEGVHVIRPGERMEYDYKRNPITDRLSFTPRPDCRGEEYALNCPFCGDEKGRLQVSHMWGVHDKRTDTKLWWLVNCFNDDNCMHHIENRQKLIQMIKLGRRHKSELSRKADLAPRQSDGPVEYPGTIWWLSDMLKRLPRHSMLEYLRARFVPPRVAAYYGAGLCMSGGGVAFDGRLVIPIFEKGKLVSWQARATGGAVGAKYLSATNTTLANFWYNFDSAIRFHTRVVVEGSIDTWGVGGPGLGCFNKSVSRAKIKMLKKADARMGKRGNYAVMLDPAMNPKDLAKGAQHHLDAAMAVMEDAFPGRVFSVRLPFNRHRQPDTIPAAERFLAEFPQGCPMTGYDPGGMPRAYLRKLIERVGTAKGFVVSWDLLEDRDDEGKRARKEGSQTLAG